MQQTKVSDPSESFWQHMEQQVPEELCTGETLDQLLHLVVFDSKGDDPTAIAKDILFRDHATTKIPTEVDQGLLTEGQVHGPVRKEFPTDMSTQHSLDDESTLLHVKRNEPLASVSSRHMADDIAYRIDG